MDEGYEDEHRHFRERKVVKTKTDIFRERTVMKRKTDILERGGL